MTIKLSLHSPMLLLNHGNIKIWKNPGNAENQTQGSWVTVRERYRCAVMMYFIKAEFINTSMEPKLIQLKELVIKERKEMKLANYIRGVGLG